MKILKCTGAISAETVDKRLNLFDTKEYTTSFTSAFEAEFIPNRNVLVQNDFINIDPICFKPIAEISSVIINWRILGRNLDESGQIELVIDPIIEEEIKTKYVSFPESHIAESVIKSKYEF